MNGLMTNASNESAPPPKKKKLHAQPQRCSSPRPRSWHPSEMADGTAAVLSLSSALLQLFGVPDQDDPRGKAELPAVCSRLPTPPARRALRLNASPRGEKPPRLGLVSTLFYFCFYLYALLLDKDGTIFYIIPFFPAILLVVLETAEVCHLYALLKCPMIPN